MTLDLTPAGKPNLQADVAPRRGTYPGQGGTFGAAGYVALRPPQSETDDEWRARDDDAKLAMAPPAARARLAEETARLHSAEAAVVAAQQGEARAREAVVAARVEGRNPDKANQHYDNATRIAADAERAAELQKEVTEALRARIIESVREDLASAARARIAAAHERYDAAVAGLVAAVPLMAEMTAARTAEAEASADLAAGLGDVPGRGFNGVRAERVNGLRYRSIPEFDRLAVVVDSARFEDVSSLAGHLARREGRALLDVVPRQRPIDEEAGA
jgi:hypothetical protein